MRWIEATCGKVVGSVSKETTVVIAGEPADSKPKKIKALGHPVWDGKQLQTLLGH